MFNLILPLKKTPSQQHIFTISKK